MDRVQVEVDEIKSVFKKYGVNMDSLWVDIRNSFNLSLLSKAGRREKRNGTPVAALFETAVAFPLFFAGTVSGFFASHFAKMVKGSDCAFYRFCQDCLFNWRKVLYAASKLVSAKERKAGLEPKYPTALIIDDTTIQKAGRRIEGVSMVHDHVTGRCVPGFKLLALVWFNGCFTRTLDFCLVAEKKLRLKNGRQFAKKRDIKSPGGEREKELRRDKVSLACAMLGRAAKRGYVPDYALVDTWFTCAKLINKIRGLGSGSVHFLGMVKPDKRLYVYNGNRYTLSQLRYALMAERKRCKRFNSRYIEVTCELKNVGQVKLFISRFARNRKWVCLLTTDLEMNYIKAVETYAIRWNIEVLFKECKQLLKLGKCQANDFDAQVAHATQVFVAHAILAYFKHWGEFQTMGQLYAAIESQYTGLSTTEKIIALLEEVLSTIAAKLGGLDNVTLRDIMNAPEYAAIKQAIQNSLFFRQNGKPEEMPNKEEVTHDLGAVAA